MRSNVFIKVFLGFWLITITVLGSWSLATRYLDSIPRDYPITDLSAPVATEHRRPGKEGPRPDQRGPGRDSRKLPTDGTGPPPHMMLRIIYGLQNSPIEDLPKLLAAARQRHNMEIYLLDPQGKDILGQTAPDGAVKAAEMLQQGKRRAFTQVGNTRYSAHSIHRRDSGQLRAVASWETTRPLIDALGASPLLRLFFAILISGVLCFILSRLVTRRIKEIQRAARKLAEGELDTRIQVKDKGGDETDELARDFNAMASELQHLIQAQRRLLQDVSHELRSPLARLRIALALAQDQPESITSHLQRIEKETGRLDQLIGQLLSSQTQEITLDSHIDLLPLLQELSSDSLMEAEAGNKKIVFHSDLPQAVVASSGELLHSSFENIIRNAIRHTAAGTEVEIRLTATAEHYLITIEDHGPGVPEEQLENIFEAFYRVDSDRNRDTGGHGLGLAIARRAVALHSGNVTASNTGTGLNITITLPVGSDH
ncbi:MAG: ATP-binding protein [Halioglobus sp.]